GTEPDDPESGTKTEVEPKEAWTVDKEIFGTNEDGLAEVGAKLTYTITIKNTGNVTITKNVTDTFTVDGTEIELNLSKSETSEGTYEDGKVTLAEGETAVLTATYEVQPEDNRLLNTVKVGTGEEDPDDEVTTDVKDTL